MHCGHALVLLRYPQSAESPAGHGCLKMIAGSKIRLLPELPCPVAKAIKELAAW
jgi:hypothetical protein